MNSFWTSAGDDYFEDNLFTDGVADDTFFSGHPMPSNTVLEEDEAAPPPVQLSVLHADPTPFQSGGSSPLELDAIDIDDSNFDFNLDALSKFNWMSWEALIGMSADDFLGAPASDEPRESSDAVQVRGDSLKRSHAAPTNSTFRKKRMMPDPEAENIPEEDIELFRDHTDLNPGVVHFLFTFKKKYESFKKLFQLNDMFTSPYQILKSSGFVFLQIINVLHPIGGYKNLEALQALTVKQKGQDQTPLQQLEAARLEPIHIVNILANNAGYKNLEAFLNFIPHYAGLTHPEKIAFLSFVSKAGTSTRVALAQRLIERHGDGIDKASLFDFLKSATNKSVVQFEALPFIQLVAQIKTKKPKKVGRGSSKPQAQPAAAAAPTYHFAEGAFSRLAGVSGRHADAIPKMRDRRQASQAAQTACRS